MESSVTIKLINKATMVMVSGKHLRCISLMILSLSPRKAAAPHTTKGHAPCQAGRQVSR